MTDVIESRYSKLVAGFTKLFSTIIHSTVWREEMHVKVVWVTMLAMADRNGRVFSSLPGLADASRVSLEQCIDALQRLSSPDPYSRTKEHEGRRIKEIDGGWELLNYLKYRETRDADERRLQTREAVRRYRSEKAKVSHSKPRKPKKAQAEAEAEAEAEALTASSVSPSVSSEKAVDGLESLESKPDEAVGYAQAVFEAIDQRNGSTFPKHSSADFDCVSKWFRDGIPLRVALEAIQGMRSPPPHARYASSAVHEEWKRVRRMSA